MSTTGLIALALLATVALGFILLGAERFWRVFGDPDLGPVSFADLQRRSSPNDALACPPGVCQAAPDIITPNYPTSAATLRGVFETVLAEEPRLTPIERNDAMLTDRYIQRSRRLGFPDTIVVQFFDRSGGQSSLAIYSRSQIGHSDLGANRNRMARWLEALAAKQKPVE